MMDKVKIILSFGDYSVEAGEIECYPTGQKVGNHYKFMVGGKEVSIRSEDWLSMQFRDHKWRIDASLESIQKAFARLEKPISLGGDGMIPVTRAGKPGIKSCKIKIQGVFHHAEQDEIEPAHSHTVTVPLSWLEERNGRLYIARWRANRVLHERVLKSLAWPKHIVGGVWLEADKVWNKVFKPLVDAIPSVKKEADKYQADLKSQRKDRHKQIVARLNLSCSCRTCSGQ